MCTALRMHTDHLYFGRNLDLDRSYGEEVCILPRNVPLTFRRMGQIGQHYAMIGMALMMQGTPLFYDAANEKGLCMAGLNFPGNAIYHPEKEKCDNITPFEFIPWILGQCSTVAEARKLLSRLNLVNIPFAPQVPLSPLHWMLSDREESIVVESMADGLHVYDNPADVMTNNPPFPYHLFQLNQYRGLSTATPAKTFAKDLDLDVFCQGLGGLGLPGDTSSMSRFVRMVFYARNSVCQMEEQSSVSQFFHLLGSVEMPRGACWTDAGEWDITVYTSCIQADTGRYYYTTYDNQQINCVDLQKADLDGNEVLVFPLAKEQGIRYQN